MNAEKVLFSALLVIIVIAAVITSIMLTVVGVNGGTLSAVLGPAAAVTLLYATYKFCAFFCKRVFHNRKAKQ